MDLVGFFLAQHANQSFADRVFGGLSDAQMRVRPGKGVNSLVWLLWHMARVEDVAVNLVVVDGQQVLDDDWARRLNVPWRHIGTGMIDDEVGELTARADVAAVPTMIGGVMLVPAQDAVGHLLIDFRRDDLGRMLELLDLIATRVVPAVNRG